MLLSKYLKEHNISFTRKESFLVLLKILISLGFIVYLTMKIEPGRLFMSFKGANYFPIIIAVVLVSLNIYTIYIRWRLLAKKCLAVADNSSIIRSLFYGFAAGSFTPARLGEYFGRKLALPDNSILDVVLATAIDKMFTLFLTLLFGSLASVLYLHFILQVTPLLTISLFVIILVLFVILGLSALREEFWQYFIRDSLKKVGFLRKIFEKFLLLRQLDNKTLMQLFLYSCIHYLTFNLQFALLVVGFNNGGSLWEAFWAGGLMFFSKTIIPVFTIGELGVREAASMYFVSHFGFQEAAGFSAAMILFILNIAIPAFIGVLLFFKRGNGR